MDQLEKFIKFITSIGFVKSDYFRWDGVVDSPSYSYDGYHIGMSSLQRDAKAILPPIYSEYLRFPLKVNKLDHYRWSIFKEGDWLRSEKNKVNFGLDDIDILKDIFKSELRNVKIEELGI